MLILLPPSETKRSGGDGASWNTSVLALPELTPLREAVVDALVRLSADPDAAAAALKLGPTLRGEIEVNRALRTSPTMPAIDRYTGVLFDALDASALDAESRVWLGENVLVHSAPFGPVGALDPIPAYRLAAGIRLPGLPPLRRLWAGAVTGALENTGAGFILDLRSEAYVALGPAPAGRTAYVRVLTRGADGRVRALNHFNKAAKGDLVRRLALSRPTIGDVQDLIAWGKETGLDLGPAPGGELALTV